MSRTLTVAGCALTLIAILHGRDVFAADRPAYCGTKAWQPIIREAAQRFDLQRALLDAVIRAESAGCASMNGTPTVSAAAPWV